MDRLAISGDVVLYALLVGICGLKTGDEELKKFVDDGVEGVNVGDVEATNSGGYGHNFEVTEANEALVGHVNGKPVGSKKVGTKNGFRDICHMKYLSEVVGLAEQEGHVAFAP